ncbi:hypothetical protein M3Y94_00125000 [Aphelenchoides besseyi]|nr:hypothetical protein M3Y94_00125000 [Aphelenchoides besseyi]KAI6237397.1 hypothetical protein M3Y95_00260700 [Aphelenchoides besseyi]
MNGQVLFLIALVGVVGGSPAIEKEFHRIVNSNDCLRSCMTPVRESNLELAIFKRANYSDYLMNVDRICEIISTARSCIDACGVQSNPFALESMKQICAPNTRQAVKLLEQCMIEEGANVHNECRQQCGDFELMNEEIRVRSTAMKPEEHSKSTELMKAANDACSVLKCHARCSASQFNERCGRVANGQLAGDMVQKLIEDVLTAQRVDLESHGLVEAMAQNTQPACNYLYNPRALFEQTAQPKMMSPIEQRSEPHAESNLLEVLKRNAQKQLTYTLGQLNAQVFEKQLEVLDKQERNLDREYDKINMDIARRMQQKQPFFFRPMF